jgi:hypothetical protein
MKGNKKRLKQPTPSLLRPLGPTRPSSAHPHPPSDRRTTLASARASPLPLSLCPVGPTCRHRPPSSRARFLPLSGGPSPSALTARSLALVGPRTPPVSHLRLPNLLPARPTMDAPTSRFSCPPPHALTPFEVAPPLTHSPSPVTPPCRAPALPRTVRARETPPPCAMLSCPFCHRR